MTPILGTAAWMLALLMLVSVFSGCGWIARPSPVSVGVQWVQR